MPFVNWQSLLNSPKEKGVTIIIGQRNEDCGGVRGLSGCGGCTLCSLPLAGTLFNQLGCSTSAGNVLCQQRGSVDHAGYRVPCRMYLRVTSVGSVDRLNGWRARRPWAVGYVFEDFYFHMVFLTSLICFVIKI